MGAVIHTFSAYDLNMYGKRVNRVQKYMYSVDIMIIKSTKNDLN